MRRCHDVIKSKERRVGAWLGREDIESSASNPTGCERLIERLFVEHATTSGIDDPNRRFYFL